MLDPAVLDAALLSRLQFAFTVSFHIVWPSLTIGLCLFLFILETLWLKTADTVYLKLYKFFVKIFALAFGMGVVTGIPLAWQFGTNFSELSRIAGSVLGPLMGVEVMTAFFLEAAFIGVMLFGWDRVSPRLHYLATFLVMLGTHNSAFWVVSANSWLHTPAGVEMIDGVMVVKDWWAVIFNPSFPYRVTHMLLASYLSATVMVAGVCAWYLIKRQHVEIARKGFSLALWLLLFLAPLQALVGDNHGLQVLRDQPRKIAAMEGVWHTERQAPLLLFAVPDKDHERNEHEVKVPGLASLILTHHLDGEIKGLTEWPRADRPPVAPVFFSFRVMVGLGLAFIALGVTGLGLRRGGRLYQARPLLWLACLLTPAGFVATIAGWWVAEIGRQPYLIDGILRTADAVSPVPAAAVASSLAAYLVVYGLMLIAFFYYCHHLVQRGPLPLPGETPAEQHAEGEWLAVAGHASLYTPDSKGAQ